MSGMNDDKLGRIMAHPLLRDLPDGTRAEIRQLLVKRTVRAGAHVFSKGGQPSGWFGVVEGEVAIVTASALGHEIVLTILSPGDWFGEVAILAGAMNSHDAVARGNCEVAFIPTTAFRQLLVRQPDLYGRFVMLLAQRVRMLVDIVEDFTSLPMAARLAKRVLAMADSQAMGSVARRGRVSQEEYALLVGATRQSVNQELRRWEKAGWIRIGYRGVEVIDREALKREIGGI
jgi:CRP/FNR family transcriptional regulator, cyclic AMP receptor protein